MDNADDNDDEDQDIELILLLTRNSKSTRKVQLDSYQIKPKKNLQTPMMIKNCQKLKLRKLRIVRKTWKQKRVLRMILCLKNAFEIPSKLEITEEEVNKKRGERIQATHCCHQVRPWCYWIPEHCRGKSWLLEQPVIEIEDEAKELWKRYWKVLVWLSFNKVIWYIKCFLFICLLDL